MICILIALSLMETTMPVLRSIEKQPILDGRVVEYGEPTFSFPNGMDTVNVWIKLHGSDMYFAAVIPDTGYYWGDDFVISLDVDGSGGKAPGNGDRQWYLRRDLDSSLVLTASNGRWMQPGHEPPPIGKTRHGKDWDVASSSDSHGWTVELRYRPPMYLTNSHVAFRTYDSNWWSFPAPRVAERATVVERTPDRWIWLY